MENNPVSVSECIALVNQTMEYAFPVLLVEGEVSSFKVNQNKYVFFDIKDATGTLNCFMSVFQLRIPIEDGMRVQVVATPKLTQWGRFSLTVRTVQPKGEGSIRRAFDLLKAKLEKEGLFDIERKRPLPALPSRIGVISSVQSAGYIDFVTLLNKRWGGMEVMVTNVQVQGTVAPKQIIKALEYFNQIQQPPEVIVITRGGGSADDLSVFNDEPLVRAIAASRTPTLVGVGHEIDTTLADMVADVRAATPSNAAQLLVPDRSELIAGLNDNVRRMVRSMQYRHESILGAVRSSEESMLVRIEERKEDLDERIRRLHAVLRQLDPKLALKRGYALVKRTDGSLIRGTNVPDIGDVLTIELDKVIMKTGVKEIHDKKD